MDCIMPDTEYFIPNDSSDLNTDNIYGPGICVFAATTGDLSVDFSLFRLSRYSLESDKSDKSDKVELARLSAQISQQIGILYFDRLIDIMNKQAEEDSEIKLALISQILPVSSVLSRDLNSPDKTQEWILPILQKLLSDESLDIIIPALSVSIRLIPLLQSPSSIIGLVTNALQDTDLASTALIALREVIHCVSDDIIQESILPIISEIADTAELKKDIVYIIPKIIHAEGIFQLFTAFASDNAWIVRKACAETIPDLIALEDPLLASHLTLHTTQLLDDRSTSVKYALKTRLGVLLTHKHFFDQELMDKFLKLAFEEGDLQYYCAYYLPGILYARPELWELVLESYNHMCREGAVRTKQCLASSIHEIARLIGPEQTASDLLILYQGMFLEAHPGRLMALRVLSSFCESIDAASRSELLPVLRSVYSVSTDWRTRETVASQLPGMIRMFSYEEVNNDLKPMVFGLTQDKFAKVRNAAAEALGSLISYMTHYDNIEFWASFQEFRIGNWQSRMVLAEALVFIVEKDWWNDMFKEILEEFAKDRVANIRISIARAVKRGLHQFPEDQYWASMYELMKTDSDLDVVFEILRTYTEPRGIRVLRPGMGACSLTPPRKSTMLEFESQTASFFNLEGEPALKMITPNYEPTACVASIKEVLLEKL